MKYNPLDEISSPTGVKGIHKYLQKNDESTTVFSETKKGCPVHVKAAIAHNDLVRHFKQDKKYGFINNGDDKVGEMFCLGHCYENHAFHYDGENYAGKDIEKIDQIIKGEEIKQEKFFSKSFATTSFLMDDKLSSTDQFKDQLNKFLKTDKKEIVKSLLDSNLTGRGGAGFPTGMKWDFCSKAKGEKKYVICNADEGDSGAFSDRYLLEDQPLKVIFGMVLCGFVIGSDEGVLYIRGEYPKSIEAINGCINELKKLNLLGEIGRAHV